MHDEATAATLTVAIALAAGLLAQFLGRRLSVPGIVLLLLTGALLGPEGLRWVDPETLGSGLFGIVDFGVAVILFEGGLGLQLSRLRREERPVRRLITLGALVTLAGATISVRLLLGWPWALCALFGSLVIVTGPTVVTPLLRDLRLHPRLKTILEAEGVFIDPIGAILAALVLQVVLEPERARVTIELQNVLVRLGFGLVAGVVAGLLIGWLLRARFLVPHRFESVFTLAAVLLLFEACDALALHSGILAVTVAGVVVGNSRTPVDRDLREFKDQLTVLLVGLLFVLLVADIRLAEILALGWGGAAVVAALVAVVRPVSVLVATHRTELTRADQAFASWVAPRGVVAAAVASLTAVTLEAQGMAGGAELRAMVFLTIAGTVVLAGGIARPLASTLGLRLPGRERVAILGAQGLGLALGHELTKREVPVLFLDSDPKRCAHAQEEGFTVIFGDALEERTLARAQFELVGTVVGISFNEHLNSLFVGLARRLFDVPRGYVAVESLYRDEAPGHVREYEGAVLFDGAHDQERWDVWWRHDEVTIERLEYRPASEAEAELEGEDSHFRGSPRPAERWVVLAYVRDGAMSPAWMGYEPQLGDLGSVAIHEPSRELALEELAVQGWVPAEAAPEVEATQ